MKKIMALFIVGLFVFSSFSFFVAPVGAVSPSVQTNDATGIGTTNATMRGTLTDGGGQTCVVDFQYGLTMAYGSDTIDQNRTIGQTFSVNQSGLTKGATYHYRARAKNYVEKITANQENGTTQDVLSADEQLRSAEVFNLSTTQYISGAAFYLTRLDGNPHSVTFEIRNTVGNPSVPDTGAPIASASVTPSGWSGTVWRYLAFAPVQLQANTNYAVVVRVYGQNFYAYYDGSHDSYPNGYRCRWNGMSWTAYTGTDMRFRVYNYSLSNIGYGADKLFLTKPDPLTGLTATPITAAQINLNWTNGIGGDGAYIEYSTGSAPSPWNVGSGTKLTTAYMNDPCNTWTNWSLHPNWEIESICHSAPYAFSLSGSVLREADRLTLANQDMSNYTGITVDWWWYVWGLGNPSYYFMAQAWDGTSWNTMATTYNNGGFVHVSYNLGAAYCKSGFSIRFKMSGDTGTSSRLVAVDDVVLTGLGKSRETPFSHTGLTPGAHYFYKVWPVAYDSGLRSDGSTIKPYGDYPLTVDILLTNPTVTTNNATNVEETTASLNAYLTQDGGIQSSVDCQYGLTTGYGFDSADEILHTGQYYTLGSIVNLLRGRLYHFIARASNINGTSYGSDKTFLTKPADITNVASEWPSAQRIDLTWTNGIGGDGAYIEYSIGTSPDPWNPGGGTKVNATGYINGAMFNHTGLINDSHYFYKIWPYAEDVGFKSDGTAKKPFGTPHVKDQWIASNATVITISSPYPSDDAKGISRYIVMGINTENWQGYPMDVIWSSNVTGIWNILGINSSVYNGRYGMSSYGIVDSPHDVTILYPFTDYVGENYTSNPCYGNNLGTITAVRIFTNYTFTPKFNGNILGSEYIPIDNVAEITNDYQAPTQWTWQDIKNLDIKMPNQDANIAVTYDMSYGENLTIYWNVNVSVFGKFEQETYSFTTEKLSPTMSNPSPPDISTWSYLRPTLSVDVADPQGQSLQVKFYTTNQMGNFSSGWTQIGSYNGLNGTHTCPTTFSNYSQLYYWRVDATDGNHTISKTYRFITRPIQVPPIGLSATTVNQATINLTWSVDDSTDYVMIKRRTDRYPLFSDPGFIYEGSGTQFNDTFISGGTLYYYHGWSYNISDDTWTIENTSTDALSKPWGPTSLSAVAVSYNRMNVSWTPGSGADTTLLYRRNDHYPVSLGDGDLVYGGSGSALSDTYNMGGNLTYYYRGWSYRHVTFTDWTGTEKEYEWWSETNSSDNDKTPVGPPTIIATTPTSVTETNMILHALVISNGGDNATCGFYWGNISSEENNITIGHYGTGQSYSLPLSSLSVGTSYLVKTWGLNIHGFIKGDEKIFCTLPAGPTDLAAIANNASSISLTWVKGIGADETRIRYKTTGYPTSPTDGYSAYFNTGSSITLLGLAGNTTYYYRAWSYNNSGGFHSSVYASEIQITPVGKPSVINYYPIYINDTEVTLKGKLIYNNGDNCTCGFRYGNSPGVYTHNVSLSGLYTTGQIFQKTVIDLTIATTWYYQSWAKNIASFANSTEITFVTKPVSPSGFTLTNFGSRQFTLSWTKNGGEDKTRIVRKTGSYPVNINDGDLRYNGTGSSLIDKDWYPPLADTTYYYRMWGYNETNHLYSNNYDSGSSTTDPLLIISDEYPTDGQTNLDRYVDFSIKVDGGTDPINVTFWNTQEFDESKRILGDHAGGWSHAENDYSMSPYNGTKGGVLDYQGGLDVQHSYWFEGYHHWYSQSHTAEEWFGGRDIASTAKLWVSLENPVEISGIQFSGGASFWTTGSGGNGTGSFVSTVHFEYHDYNKNQWITATRVPLYGSTDKLYTNDIIKVDEIRMWFTREFIKDQPYYTAWRQITGRGTMTWIAFVPPIKIYNEVVSPGDTVSFQSNLTLLNYTYCWGVTADSGIDHTYSKVYNFTTEIITLKDADPREGELFNDTNPTHDCSVLVNHTGGDLMDIRFYTKADNGTYMLKTTYDDTGNGTYGFTYSDSGSYGKKYYWKVVANDTLNEYSDVYFFQMRDTYVPSNAQIETAALNKTAIRLYDITRDNKSDTLLIRYKEGDAFWPFDTYSPMGGYPVNQTDGIFLMNSTDTVFTHSGLQEWTQYNYSAWGWNATDELFGSRYSFFGRTEGGQKIEDETPDDNLTGVHIYPMIGAYISDFDFDLMNISIRTNASGSWVTLYQWIDVGDGQRETNATMADTQNTHYWWSINATDTTYWTNKSFNFWTGSITPPLNFTAVSYSPNQINLTWDRGQDADRVQIVRRTDHYPTNRTDGTVVYNGTGNQTLDTGLSPGIICYYRGYGYNNSIHTWGYDYSQEKELTYPEPPTDLQVTAYNHRTLNFTWTQGIGANKTIIVGKYDFYPVNSTDGDIIYNSTGLSASHTGLKPNDYLSYLEPVNPGINNMGVYPLGGEKFTNSTDGNESSKWDPDAGKNNQTFSYTFDTTRFYSTHLLVSDFYHDSGATWNAGISKIEIYNGTWQTAWTGDMYSPTKQWLNYNVSTPWDIYSNVTQVRYTAWTQFIAPNVYEAKVGKLGFIYKYSAYSYTEMDGLAKVSLDAAYAEKRTQDTPLNTPPEFSGPLPNGTRIEPHPTLKINITDRQGQAVRLTWESNYTGIWQTIGTSVVHNGTANMPTLIGFNTSVYWRVKANDSADVADSIFYKGTDTNTSPTYYFKTRKPYAEAAYSYTPLNPTNDDTIKFTDLSKNTTHVLWRIDATTLSEATYLTIINPPLNASKKMNISNVYNVTIEVQNQTDSGYNILSSKQIHVNRNLTLLKTPVTGINYVAYHLNGKTNSIAFANTFHIPSGWWIHRYNSTSKNWESYWVNQITNNFTINTWDAVVIAGYDQRTVNILTTQHVTTHQTKTIPAGITYLVWSSETPTTLMNISIGLAAGDWIHAYDTLNNEWNSRWISNMLVGKDIQIKPYDVFAVSVSAPRTINIG